MKKVLGIVLGIVLLVGLVLFGIWLVAIAKDTTFVELIKSWFEKGEVIEEAESVEQALACMIRR